MNMELEKQQTMEMENPQMLELSADQMSEREQRRTEIEQTFDYDGYQSPEGTFCTSSRSRHYNKERQHYFQHSLHCGAGGCGLC